MEKIVKIQLELVASRLMEKHITLTWEEAVTYYLAKEGYDPVFGARPLKRLIGHKVVTLLSRAILEGKILPGKEVQLKIKDSQICYS